MKIITIFKQLQRARLTNKYVEIKIFYKSLPDKIKTCNGRVTEIYTKNAKKLITTQEEGTIIITKGSNFEIKIYESKNDRVLERIKKEELDLSRSINEPKRKTSKGDVRGGNTAGNKKGDE